MTRGRTRWPVFAAALTAGVAGLGVLLGGVATGSIAASFAVSGTSYKATADKMTGTGVVQYGATDDAQGQPRPVVVNGIRKAEMTNFCQSIVFPVPGLGSSTIKITSPRMAADDLVLALDSAAGDLTMTTADLGVDAGTLSRGPSTGEPGTFGIQAAQIQFERLRQVAWSTTASTLRLDQVRIQALPGRQECF